MNSNSHIHPFDFAKIHMLAKYMNFEPEKRTDINLNFLMNYAASSSSSQVLGFLCLNQAMLRATMSKCINVIDSLAPKSDNLFPINIIRSNKLEGVIEFEINKIRHKIKFFVLSTFERASRGCTLNDLVIDLSLQDICKLVVSGKFDKLYQTIGCMSTFQESVPNIVNKVYY